MKRLLAIAAASLGLAGLVLPGALRAAEFSPPTFDLAADPGGIAVDVIRVRNDGAAPATYRVSAMSFAAQPGDETGGLPDLYPASEERDGRGLGPWISFPRAELTLQPGERGELPFTVSVPADADPGSRFGAAVITESSAEGETGVGVVGSTALLILLRVNGEAVEEARLSSFTAAESKGLGTPVRFEARVENAGTVHLRPFGEVRIRNVFGAVVASVPINRLEYKSVLPGGARRYAAEWDGGTFALGPYTAELSMGYGTGGQELAASARFWTVPWTRLLIAVGAVALFLLAVTRLLRWQTRRILRRHEGQGTR